MITQAARLSARHQVGHYNPILAFSRGNRSLFTTYNVSPSGTRKYVMPQVPVQPDPPTPRPQMTPTELLQARASLGGAIGMTLQEWRELTEAMALDAENDWSEVDMFRTYLGKPILITIEAA